MVKWFLLAIVALVVGEVVTFFAVGAAIGIPQAFLLMIVTSCIGILVLRHPGRSRIEKLHVAVSKAGISGLKAGGDAFLMVSAGVLLLIPGFLTDTAGLLLLLPPVRAWLGRRFHGGVHTQPTDVVDLEPNQWNRVPERQIDDQRRPNDPN
jgi:UPF0716 protein FxsA